MSLKQTEGSILGQEACVCVCELVIYCIHRVLLCLHSSRIATPSIKGHCIPLLNIPEARKQSYRFIQAQLYIYMIYRGSKTHYNTSKLDSLTHSQPFETKLVHL